MLGFWLDQLCRWQLVLSEHKVNRSNPRWLQQLAQTKLTQIPVSTLESCKSPNQCIVLMTPVTGYSFLVWLPVTWAHLLHHVTVITAADCPQRIQSGSRSNNKHKTNFSGHSLISRIITPSSSLCLWVTLEMTVTNICWPDRDQRVGACNMLQRTLSQRNVITRT